MAYLIAECNKRPFPCEGQPQVSPGAVRTRMENYSTHTDNIFLIRRCGPFAPERRLISTKHLGRPIRARMNAHQLRWQMLGGLCCAKCNQGAISCGVRIILRCECPGCFDPPPAGGGWCGKPWRNWPFRRVTLHAVHCFSQRRSGRYNGVIILTRCQSLTISDIRPLALKFQWPTARPVGPEHFSLSVT